MLKWFWAQQKYRNGRIWITWHYKMKTCTKLFVLVVLKCILLWLNEANNPHAHSIHDLKIDNVMLVVIQTVHCAMSTLLKIQFAHNNRKNTQRHTHTSNISNCNEIIHQLMRFMEKLHLNRWIFHICFC